MNRRDLLVGAAALASTRAIAVELRSAASRPRVLVVGAGIIGASIAYHLAGRGADVVVVEKRSPGAGATQGAFATLISSHDEGPSHLNELYGLAVLDWRRLQMELGSALPIQWGGTLLWEPPGPGADELRAALSRIQRWGSSGRQIDPEEFAQLAPGINPGPVGAAAFAPNEGTLDPQLATDVLIARARHHGALFRYPCEALKVVTDGARVTAVETTQGRLSADTVVIAAGEETDRLARQAGAAAPHTIAAGALAHSAPHRPVLSRVLVGPEVSLKQNPDGRIVTGLDYRPGARAEQTDMAYGEHLLELAARTVPATRGARLERMTVGRVPIPQDGQPIIGFVKTPPNLYLALTMSGITMAPILGRFAATEIMDRLEIDFLGPYRPARFS